MTEDNKSTDKIKEEKADIESADIAIREKEDTQPAPMGGFQSSSPALNLEELPDDVKKKLEARKTEKTGKAVGKGKGKIKKRKKTVEKRVTSGKAYIKATYNNTMVTLTDLNGNVISWASAGIAGFRGPKKSTPYAAQIITRIAVEKARQSGLEEVSVFVKGVGTGRESAVRALNANGLNVISIKDITPIPHNGCRKKKPRRV